MAVNLYGQSIRKYDLPAGIDKNDYSQSKIIVRLKQGTDTHSRTKSSAISDIQDLVQRTGSAGFRSIVKKDASIDKRTKPHPLSNIYQVILKPQQDPVRMVNALLQYPEVLYAEPYFIHRPLFVPDDPESKTNKNQGPYLSLIKAYEAWDITKGDTTMIVAILDTGTKLNHEDLEDNLWINYSDPINGMDDDNDGLTDNYFGYDFADDDNDATADFDGHGAEVAGVSSATTNNSIGIAGIGFNCRYMPLKIFTSEDNSFSNGYEAVIFAADKGARVINLSWGSEDAFSQFGQDAINYAVLEKDAVILAAAGNTDDELDFYPASFDNVLSVGATNLDDEKTAWATYSYKIDLMAPGENIFTTRSDGNYGSNQGTSLASPMVAGAAALLRSYKPELSARQIMEKLRITADDIYEIPANQPFIGQLGKGRLNILKALTDNISPSVRFEDIVYDNQNSSKVFFKDTLTISGTFINYLQETQDLKVSLSSESPNAIVLDSVFIAGSLETMDAVANVNTPFRIRIADNTPPESRLLFRINYKDGFYEDFQYFEIITSPDFATVNNGSVSMTLSGNGNLGFDKDGYSDGVGFTFNNEKLLDHIGMLLGKEDSLFLSNNMVTVPDSNQRDHDFEAVENIRFYDNSIAFREVRSSFRESDSVENPIDIRIDQKLITADTSMGNFLILEYRLVNQSGNMIDTLFASIFADWDLGEKTENIAVWSTEDSLGYVFHPNADSLYAGIALLTPQDPIHFSTTIESLGDTLDRSLKHSFIEGGISDTGTGSPGNEDNVSHFVGGSVTDLEINGVEKVAFAFLAGKSLADIRSSLDSARSFYSFYRTNPPLEYISFACEGDSALIDPPGTLYEYYADINRDSLIFSGETFKTPPVFDPVIFYAVNMDSVYESELIKMKAEVKYLNPDFSFSPDTVYLDESGNNQAHFMDLSQEAVSWSWDFDNGFASTARNPTTSFFDPGEYVVSLLVENDIGCEDSVRKTVPVLQRGPRPQIDTQLICRGDSVTLDPSNAETIRVYSGLDLAELLYEGQSFSSGTITSDTSFYITNIDTGIESLPTEAFIQISGLSADFSYSLDTLNLDVKYLLNLRNESQNAISHTWLLDGLLYSNSMDTLLDYSDLGSFDLTLVAQDSLGCELEFTKSITPVSSPAPIIAPPDKICKEESVLLFPTGGDIYFFYSDRELDSLIHKGSNLYLDSVTSSKDIFVISMDSLLDSDTVKVPVSVSALTADFSMTPDSLNLTEGNSVQFQSLSEEAITWFWDFDNGLNDTTASPVISFNEPGEYMIFLRTTDSINCVAAGEKRLPVVSILPIGESIKEDVRIYPNPSDGRIIIRSENTVTGFSNIALYDLNGHLILNRSLPINNSVSVLLLPPISGGEYFLQIEVNGRITTRKLIIR